MSNQEDKSEADKEFDRAEFDAFHNENIKGKRINNRPYPDYMKSAQQKTEEEKSMEKTKELINDIASSRHREYR